MKLKPFITVSAVFLAVILIFSILLGSAYRKLGSYEQTENEAYQKNLKDLNSVVDSINLLLNKGRYCSSHAVMSSFVSELYTEAQKASNILSRMSDVSRPKTLEKFLSGVSNYALSISKNIIKGENLNEAQQQNLKLLADASKAVADVISAAEKDDRWTENIETALTSAESLDIVAKINELEENITDFATLAYEGPYSEHIISNRAIFLENKSNISADEATEKIEALGLKKDDFKYSGEKSDKIACYNFTGENTNLAISKSGGYPVYYLKSRAVKINKTDTTKAISKAQDILEKSGYKNMRDTYYYIDNGVCVINFVFLDGQTLCYTDLIKVGIALDNGELLFFEATGYLFNHTERAFKTPTYTVAQAEEKLNPSLTVKEVKVALIPTEEPAEKRCYEFLCEGESREEILVYINVNTLAEEQIFILIKSDNGTKLR